jgi:general secretion pathway protein G
VKSWGELSIWKLESSSERLKQTPMPNAQPSSCTVASLSDALFRRSTTPPAGHRLQSRTRHASRGFSLIELLVVLSIILIIVVLAVPHLIAALNEARVSRATGEIHAIEVNITIYQATNNGNLPTDLSQIEATSLIDPWGNPYQYFNHVSGTGNGGMLRQDLFLVPLNEDYDLYSLGADGLTAASLGASVSLDDIIRGSSGAYTGPASQY